MSINVCTFSGRMTIEPEMSYTNGGMAVTNFKIVVDGWDSRSKVRTSTFLPFVCFDKLAEKVYQHIKKGDFIEIVSRLQEEKWQDRNGIDRVTYKFVCSQVEFTPAKGAYAKEKPSNIQEPPYYQDPDTRQQAHEQTSSSDSEDANYVPY